MDNKIFKTAIYCRLSRDDKVFGKNSDKAESNSIVGQKAYCKEFVSKNKDMELVCEPFVDDGYSGVNFDRPNFIKMFVEIQKGNIDCVVVRDLSRFARDYIDAGRYLEKIFPSLGVRFIAINDNYDSQTSNHSSDSFIIPFKNLINDAYCKDISVKIRSSLETKRKKGELTSALAPYGYKKSEENYNKLVIDDEASVIVELIYSLYKDGLSIGKIANRLNEIGILSPFEYKRSKGIVTNSYFKKKAQAKWEYTSVRRILTDEVYIGVLAQGKTSTPNYKVKVPQKKDESEWIRVENTHRAIVSYEDFFAIKELLSRDMRSTHTEGEYNPLSGFIFCADCGSTMLRKKNVIKGKSYIYYKCISHVKNKNCSSHCIGGGLTEELVFKAIHEQIELVLNIDELFAKLDNSPFKNREIITLEMQIQNLDEEIAILAKRKLRLYDDYSDKIISKEEYDNFYSIYNKSISEKEIIKDRLLKEIKRALESGTTSKNWTEIFRENKNFDELNRRVLLALVDKVLIHENHCIEIVFKYKDEFNAMIKYLENVKS